MEIQYSILSGKIIVYPLLFAAYPVLTLYAINMWQIRFSIIRYSFLVTITAVTIGWIILTQITEDVSKASLVITVLGILFFSYGRVQKGMLARNLTWGKNRYLLPLWWFLALTVIFFIVRFITNFTLINTFLNVASLSIFSILLTHILVSMIQKRIRVQSPMMKKIINQKKLLRPPNPPDIYYIVLDGYMRADVLKQAVGFDNRYMIHKLEDLGFYVARESNSNYPYTMLSIASSLNMDYFFTHDNESDRVTRDYTRTYSLLYDHRVGRMFKDAGYRFIQVVSWWEGTNRSAIADELLTWRPVGEAEEFNRILLGNTAYYALLGKNAQLVQIKDQRQATLYQFNQLAEVGNQSQPTFVFAHIISPHPPYVFGRRGETVMPPEIGWSAESSQAAYLNQLIYLNSKILNLVKRILTTAKVPPVIVLQSDHGWAWAVGWDLYPKISVNEKFDVSQVFGILNAYHLPKLPTQKLYPSISPVNTFRLIFNTYFGTKLKLLTDKSYYSDYYKSPYRFVDVTNKLSQTVIKKL